MFRQNRRSFRTLCVATVLLLAEFLLPGLSAASIGGIQISKAVSQDFEARRFDSDYRYYALMDGGTPYAIVGLHKEYRINDLSWKKVSPNSPKISSMINLVEFFPVQGSMTYGAFILDSEGKRIGTFYSSLTAGVTVDNQNKTVSITTDNSWL